MFISFSSSSSRHKPNKTKMSLIKNDYFTNALLFSVVKLSWNDRRRDLFFFISFGMKQRNFCCASPLANSFLPPDKNNVLENSIKTPTLKMIM